jgi:hypothetical protein
VTDEQRVANALAAAQAAVEAFSTLHTNILLEIELPVAVIIVSHLQLALRHPGNVGSSADIARGFAMELIGAMPEGPLQNFMMMGFDPAHDVPRVKL